MMVSLRSGNKPNEPFSTTDNPLQYPRPSALILVPIKDNRKRIYTVTADKEVMHIKEIIRQAALIISNELAGNCRLFLFGSRAQDTGSEKSDIDIGILSNTRITGRQLLAIQEKLEQIPTLLKIDVVDFNSVDDEFKKIALKHAQDIEI